ncbi:MAG TPA: UDP-2,3-diacylglucosamine diphosphatase LpxI [Pseudolabrys sp.]|nr:UDP-2,3-diacylglucosamine diphosphatase LpxI [Pseudolabrys sp.]
MTALPATAEEGPLALICGGGSLPLAIADSVSARGRRVFLFPLYGEADPAGMARYPHHWLYLGQGGKFRRLARAAGCRDVVLIGSLVRPALWQVRPDFATLRELPHIIAAFRGGDDHLLSSIGGLFERHGFRLLGAHDVAPEILMPEGVLGSKQPTENDRGDIALGFDYLRAAGEFDVGQAVVVADRHVLAVEAAEGTDAMLARVAEMRASGRVRSAAGVLVKAPKPGQDRRFDLPSIGPRTVDAAAQAGLSGIAVVAGSTVVAEPEQLIAAANRANVFVIGAPAETTQ